MEAAAHSPRPTPPWRHCLWVSSFPDTKVVVSRCCCRRSTPTTRGKYFVLPSLEIRYLLLRNIPSPTTQHRVRTTLQLRMHHHHDCSLSRIGLVLDIDATYRQQRRQCRLVLGRCGRNGMIQARILGDIHDVALFAPPLLR